MRPRRPLSVHRGVSGLRFLHLLFLGLSLGAPPSGAGVEIRLDRLRHGPFILKDAIARIGSPGYRIRVKRMQLPFPPWQIRQLELDCRNWRMEARRLFCRQGFLSGSLPELHAGFRGRYHFKLAQGVSSLSVDPLHLATARWQLNFQSQGSRWQAHLMTPDLPLAIDWFRPLLPAALSWLERISGHLGFEGTAQGDPAGERLRLTVQAKGISFNDSDYSRVAERLGGRLQLRIDRQGWWWHGRWRTELLRGELLYLPVYLSLTTRPVHLRGGFRWDRKGGWLQLTDLRLLQDGVGEVTAGSLQIKLDNGIIARGVTAFRLNLSPLFQLYIQPFLEDGNWEGLSLKSGRLRGQLRWRQNHLVQGSLIGNGIIVTDRQRRIGIHRLNAHLSWHRHLDAASQPFPTSWIGWRAGHLYAIPFGGSSLLLRVVDDGIRLLQPATVPVLDGRLKITQLAALDLTGTPRIRFSGSLENVSLEPLTRVLGFPPLAGSLSGTIPAVVYDHRHHSLKLDGQIVIRAFNGRIVIDHLSVTDLFGALPRLQADITFQDLDLELLTRHFSFGRITGRLEGYIRHLRLENWRPVAFDAWFATPAADKSRKRISQKAVENLTDLGGGGTAGLLSRTFLRLFDEFNYERLGLGCRLSHNVCELRGITPDTRGFHIVKGSGLPRIDVIGYNRKIDWPTLLDRLARITQFDKEASRSEVEIGP